MSDPTNVALADLSVGLRVGDNIYYWTADLRPDIDGLHRDVARAILTHALSALDEDTLLDRLTKSVEEARA